MAESTTESETTPSGEGIVVPAPTEHTQSSDIAPEMASIIWTPRFIILFALVLVSGLSIESVLTQVILNGQIAPGAVLIMHALPIVVCWLMLAIRTRSPWLRLGGIFGILW